VPHPVPPPTAEPPSSPESSEPPPTAEPPESPEPPSSPESSEEPPSNPESSEEPPESPEPSEEPPPISEPPESPEPPPISEPPESPEPAGPPAGYELLFEDDFDEGSLANFVQGDDNTGDVTVDEAAGTATITLPAGVSQPREELSINSSRQHFAEGQQFVLELERWLSPDTAPAGPGDHFTIAQFKGDAGRFPMVSEEFGNYNNQGTGLYVQDKNRTTNASFRVADYGLGEWHTDRIYVLVSKTGLGAYSVSADGKQVASATGINTLEPADSYGFIKVGAYGQPQGRAVEMKLRNIRVYVPE
jgi:hypothetical protein